jgi:catechol 2,3-dioxygenase-like lactoylglutathione lyase family enzyme
VEILAARMLVRPVDSARTLSFYRDVLKLAVYREFPGGTVFFLGGGYLEVSGQATAAEAKGTAASPRASPGEERSAPEPPPSDPEPDERVRLWIQVRDLATAYRTLIDREATIVRPPRREPWGLNEMWVVDPDGLRIGIVEVPPLHPLRRDPAAHRQAAAPRRGGNRLPRRRWATAPCRSSPASP